MHDKQQRTVTALKYDAKQMGRNFKAHYTEKGQRHAVLFHLLAVHTDS